MRVSGQFQPNFCFLRKDFARTKIRHKQKATDKTKLSKQKTTKATIFRMEKNFWEGENRLFCILMLFYGQNCFVKDKKEKKSTWNCPDNLLYYWCISLSTSVWRISLYAFIFICDCLWESLLFVRIFWNLYRLCESMSII